MAETITGTPSVETPDDFGKTPESKVRRWLTEIKAYNRDFEAWEKRAAQIVRRYRDDSEADSAEHNPEQRQRRYNIFWSNVQTLGPALLSRTPKAVVQRRNKDRDPVSQAASEILQRDVQLICEEGGFGDALKAVRDDYLIAGRGQLWVRYDPSFGAEELGDLRLKKTEDGSYLDEEEKPVTELEGMTEDDQGPFIPGKGKPFCPVIDEAVKFDYVPWQDFGHTPAPRWEKVSAVWKRELMTRQQLIKRFGEKVGQAVQLTKTAYGLAQDEATKYGDVFKRAEVFEIWDKDTKTALWISSGYSEGPLDELDDPLQLQHFFPCPRPVYATMTTNSLVPVPDYVEYQAQALELDLLTQRIDKLGNALRVAGAYDSSFPALEGILRGADNTLIPVDQWTAFADKGGVVGAISFLPIKEVAEVLMQLTNIRNQIKQDLYEITGLSDLVRGQSDASTTATAEQIKGKFVTLRLKDRQQELARIACDALRIAAEILSRQFDPQKLLEMSGWLESSNARALNHPMVTPPAQPPAPVPASGSPPGLVASGTGGVASPAPAPMLALPAPPQPNAQQVAVQAITLLKDDCMRTFRVDVETDSTVFEDAELEKSTRVEFLTAVSGFLAQALPAAQQYPQLKPLLGEMLMFGVRAFSKGAEMENAFEETVDGLNQMPPGNPEEQGKHAGDALKHQVDQGRLALEHDKFQHSQMDSDRTHAFEVRKADHQHELEMEKLKIQGMGLELQLEEARNARVDRERQHQLEQDKLADQKVARSETRSNQLEDKKMEGWAFTTEDEVKEVADALTMLGQQIAQMQQQMMQQMQQNMQMQHQMMLALTAPKRLVRDEQNRIVGSETVIDNTPTTVQ